tara:strand:- start:178 stop:384 length:207 start_codon:yes stop_codon:yes gene_type:complete
MSCDDCADNRLGMRVQALKLAVEGASISHKIDFEETADRYYVWLMSPDKDSYPMHTQDQIERRTRKKS